MKTYLKLMSVFAIVLGAVNLQGKALVVSEDTKSTVTIPLSDYLNLIKPQESVSLTTIESAVLSGEFGEKLHLRVSGISVGQAAPQAVLASSPQFMISKCSGSANIVNKDQMISVLAKDKKFQVDCELSVKSWGELVFNFSEVLFVGSDIHGAESSIEGSRVVLHRKLKELTGAASEVTVVGRYQVSVLPESTKFSYYFEINNPNRGKKSYSLPLVNGESVTQIQTAVEYKESEDKKISLNLNPGNNIIQITGALSGTQWASPVPGATQYLMIQNNPMLQLKIETSAKRISNEDSRMPASFSSSRTYLLDPKSKFNWEVKKLEVIASTGFSVGQASYYVYVPDAGPGVVEAHFAIQNKGTPELALHIPGKPVYLEIDSQPQVLAKDADGALLTQIPNGDHQLMVQYKTEKPFDGWFVDVNELMIHPATVLSNVSIQVGFAKSWAAVFGSALTDYFNMIAWFNVLIGLVAVLFLIAFCKSLKLKKEMQSALLVLGFVLHCLKPGLLFLTIAVLLVSLLAHYREQMSTHFGRWNKWQKAGFVVFALLVVFVFQNFVTSSGGNIVAQLQIMEDQAQAPMGPTSNFSPALSSARSTAKYKGPTAKARFLGSGYGGGAAGAASVAVDAAMPETVEAESPPPPPSAVAFAGAETGDDFKGLPAKLRIPAAEHSLSFSQGMVDEKVTPKVRLLAVNPIIINVFIWASFLLFIFVVYREREQFIAYLRLRSK